MHLMERKFNDFVVNKTIENIVQKNILKSKDSKSIHMNPATYAGGSRIVKSLNADHSYKISRFIFEICLLFMSLWTSEKLL